MIIIAKIRTKILKSVKLKESVSHECLGCDVQYFEKYVKGVWLKVIQEYERIALVEDSRGEQFTVYKSDFDTQKNLSFLEKADKLNIRPEMK